MPKSKQPKKAEANATASKNKPAANGHNAALIDSLVTLLGGNVKKKGASGGPKPGGHDIIVIHPSEQGIVLYCSDKEAACANLKRLSTNGDQRVEVCEQIHGRISNAILENSDGDLEGLKHLKKTLRSKIKTLLGDEPEKSYKKKVRNGREYWYEIWWDPIEKKKKDRYYGTKPPNFLSQPENGSK